jgi:hypothetical protein
VEPPRKSNFFEESFSEENRNTAVVREDSQPVFDLPPRQPTLMGPRPDAASIEAQKNEYEEEQQEKPQ